MVLVLLTALCVPRVVFLVLRVTSVFPLCVYSVFRVGRRVFSCPFCRASIGSELPDFVVRAECERMIKDSQSK